MDIQIKIDEDLVQNLSKDAEIEIKKQAEIYIKNMIKEANLIEEGVRENGACQEITSNIIIQANRRNKTNLKKKSSKLIFIKIISTFSLAIAGFLFDPNGYGDNFSGLIIFVIALIISAISTVLQFILEE